MDYVHKVKLLISLVFRVLLVVAGTIAVIKGNWLNLALSLITLFLTFLPTIIKRQFKVDYPSEFEIAILVFIYAAIYLGGIHSFYYRFWWWDLALHTLSGIIIGAIGFSLVYILNKERRSRIRLSPGFVAIFSFSFALAIGVFWEIFEFLIDSFFGFNMQKSGLIDTMWDLIVNTLGALVVSMVGYLYLKKDPKLFEKFEKKIIEKRLES